EADTDEIQGSLGFDEFCSFYKMISTRRDLYLIMISYSNQKEVLDIHDLARFLENEQKVSPTTCEVLQATSLTLSTISLSMSCWLCPRYPVILSIENHCTVPQQKKMAEYLKEVLQDKLDLTNVSGHECKKLPSPEILKGKILVKVHFSLFHCSD
ncbi:hypothetical protein XENOCAPTIV_024883, partial [Xenoophorus captivus]